VAEENTSSAETPNSEASSTETTETTETTQIDSSATEQGSSTTDQQSQDKVDLSMKPAVDDAGGDDKGDEGENKDGGEDDERAELFGAPAEGEAYTIEGLPEGMEIDKAALEAIDPVARKLNLSSAGLSMVAQVYAEKVLPHLVEQNTARLEQSIVAQRTEWEGEARDAIAGKVEYANEAGEKLAFDGKTLKEVQQVSARVLDKLAPAGFREFLDKTGLGVNPHMIALTYQVGKLIAEDRDFEDANTGSEGPTPRTKKYYGR
jgi:hypothetical protein